jgi:dUTP pyrophosphatase
MQLKIKYLNPHLIHLQQLPNSDWIDLRCSESVTLKAGEFKLIPLGVAIQLPPNHCAYVVPRSSTFKNFGVIMTNSPGVIDNSFSSDQDEWKFAAYALRDTTIAVNDRICQFRIVENQPKLEFEEVETLGNVARGGFGSSGVK